jgi:hypothetical protein
VIIYSAAIAVISLFFVEVLVANIEKKEELKGRKPPP